MFPFYNSRIDIKDLFLNTNPKKEKTNRQKLEAESGMDKVKNKLSNTNEEKCTTNDTINISKDHIILAMNENVVNERSEYIVSDNLNTDAIIDESNDKYNFTFSEKRKELNVVLNKPVINLCKLRKLTWGGIPKELRGKCWRIFLRSVNLNNERYMVQIIEKDKMYKELCVDIGNLDIKIKHQIEIDVVRIEESQRIILVKDENIDLSKQFVNILMLYAHQRPAVGYVQGMSDILVPFIKIFYQEDKENRIYAESSAYWCFARFIDNLQENYINFQSGIKNNMRLMKGIIELLDPNIVRKMMNMGLEFHMFAFRWFNCHFVREFTDDAILVIFDTMLSTSIQKKFKTNKKQDNQETIKNNDDCISNHSFISQNSEKSRNSIPDSLKEIDFARFGLFFAISFFISLKKEILNGDFIESMQLLQETNRKISVKNLHVLLSSAYVNDNIFNSKTK